MPGPKIKCTTATLRILFPRFPLIVLPLPLAPPPIKIDAVSEKTKTASNGIFPLPLAPCRTFISHKNSKGPRQRQQPHSAFKK